METSLTALRKEQRQSAASVQSIQGQVGSLQAARMPDRLADLKAEIASLKASMAQLRSSTASAPAISLQPSLLGGIKLQPPTVGALPAPAGMQQQQALQRGNVSAPGKLQVPTSLSGAADKPAPAALAARAQTEPARPKAAAEGQAPGPAVVKNSQPPPLSQSPASSTAARASFFIAPSQPLAEQQAIGTAAAAAARQPIPSFQHAMPAPVSAVAISGPPSLVMPLAEALHPTQAGFQTPASPNSRQGSQPAHQAPVVEDMQASQVQFLPPE